jgi:hypothetical protein
MNGVSHGYSNTESSFGVGTMASSELFLHGRIVSSEGFAPGSYQLQTVVTCG